MVECAHEKGCDVVPSEEVSDRTCDRAHDIGVPEADVHLSAFLAQA